MRQFGKSGKYESERKSTPVVVALTVIVIILLGVFFVVQYGRKEKAQPVIPETKATDYTISIMEPAQTVPQTLTPTTEAARTIPEPYASVIGQYHTALKNGWDAAQVMEAGLNYMVADSFFEAPMEDIGYAVTDLDGDGIEELIVGTLKEDSFYGKLIFSLYTLDDEGSPLLLIDSTERNRYYYAGDIRFANIGSSSWNDSFVTTLKLENKELVDMTYTTDPTDYVQMELTPFSQLG